MEMNFDRMVWHLENAPEAELERLFILQAGIDMSTRRLPNLLLHHFFLAVVDI